MIRERSTNVPGLRRLGGSVLQTVLMYVAALAIGLGLSILLARVLGPEGNGKYAIAVLVPSLLSTFLNLGIGPANVFFVGRGSISVEEAFQSNLTLWGVLSALGVVAAAVAVGLGAETWFPGVPPLLLWMAIAAFPLALLQSFCTSLLQARQDFRSYNLASLVTPGSTVLLAAVAVWVLGWGVAGALGAFILGQGLGVMYALSALRLDLDREEKWWSHRYRRRALSYGWRAHLGNILSFLNYRADLFLVNLLLGPVSAGVYVITIQIAERLWILSRAVSTVLLPRLSELHDREDLRRRLTPLAARWVGLLSILAALVLAPLAGFLVDLLFGAEYEAAASALRLLLPGVVAGAVARVLANDIAARGRPELNMMTAGLVLVANVVANLLLIPELGIDGAAIATTVSYGLHAITTVWMYAYLSGNRWWKPIVFGREDWAIVRQVLNGAGLRG